MAKKQVVQVGGRVEALVSVVDSSVIIQQTAEQGNADQEQQDSIRYSDLLRTFDTIMQRWRASVCIPEYFTNHYTQIKGEEAWEWEYGIAYPLTNPLRIAPKKSIHKGDSLRLEADEIGIKVSDFGDSILHDFTITAWGSRNNAFRDPYSNEKLVCIEVNLQHPDYGDERDFYSVSITETYDPTPRRKYGELKERNLEYGIGDLNTGKPYLHIQKSSEHKQAELLSEPHALALFNLMDTLIPPGLPNIASLNGRRATQEIRPPKALPPARRNSG